MKILFWTPANMNMIDGSTAFVNKTIQFFASLPHTTVHVLLKADITNRANFPTNLLKLANVRFFEPKQFKKKIIDEKTIDKLFLQLNKTYRYNVIFIRSQNLLNHPTLFQQLPNIFLFFWSCLFNRFPLARLHYLHSHCRGIWASSPLVQKEYAKRIKTPNRISYLLPIAHPISKVAQLTPFPTSPTQPLRLCYAGKFRKQYFIDETIDAFVPLRRKWGKRIELHIYGNCFANDVNITQLKKKFTSTNGLIYHGNINNDKIDQELRKCHIGLSIRGKIHDTCLDISSKMINYAKLGIPCFANRSLINHDFYGPDYQGYVEHVNEMKSKIKQYLSSPETYRRDQLLSLEACEKYSHLNHEQRLLDVMMLP